MCTSQNNTNYHKQLPAISSVNVIFFQARFMNTKLVHTSLPSLSPSVLQFYTWLKRFWSKCASPVVRRVMCTCHDGPEMRVDASAAFDV